MDILEKLLSTSSWILDAGNGVVTNWDVWKEEGQVIGYKARLMESAGRPVRARLTSCRAVSTATQFKLGGEKIAECDLDQGRVVLQLTANEWVELEARF